MGAMVLLAGLAFARVGSSAGSRDPDDARSDRSALESVVLHGFQRQSCTRSPNAGTSSITHRSSSG
jgi:hypothetical protein